MTNRYPLWRTSWAMSLVAILFMALTPWLGYGGRGDMAESLRDITVHQGRLSVHLQDADVRDILTAIRQQAGITIVANIRPGIRVSAQFSGIPINEGLRRLLRLASLGSSMVYAHDSTGAIVLTSVHVFEEVSGPASHPQLAAERSGEEAAQSFAEALAQLSSTVPPVPEVGKNDGVERFRALIESAQHHGPSPGAREESDLARHFREVLEQTMQSADETSSPDGSESIKKPLAHHSEGQ